ncbi:MAG TPA: hypothetical protein VF170_15535, partial [Planctomycetaceae bacterium]
MPHERGRELTGERLALPGVGDGSRRPAPDSMQRDGTKKPPGCTEQPGGFFFGHASSRRRGVDRLRDRRNEILLR